MKKSFKLAGIALVLAAAVFTSCAPAASSDDKRIYDDVELSSVAFPGYNYIVYTPVSVTGVYDLITNEVKTEVAAGSATVSGNVTETKVPNVPRTYILYRNDGKQLETFTSSSNSSNDVPLDYYFVDYDIVDGEKYEYTLYLDGKKIKSTEVTAIKPEYSINGKLTTASDLVAYDNWSDEVVTADNITVDVKTDVNRNNRFIVTFPAKQYLTYEVQLYKGNGLELFGNLASVDTNLTASRITTTKYYKPDYVAKYANNVTEPGEYTVKVTVSATGYEDDVVVASKKVTIDALDVATGAGTGTVNGAYIDEGETIRLVWTPAKKADQSNWSADNYKVYTLDSKGVYTLVSEKVKEAEAEAKDAEETAEEVIKSIGKDTQSVYSDVYYLDYKVENNKVAYTFVVVLSDNGKFENLTNKTEVRKYAAKDKADDCTVSAEFNDKDEDGADNDLVLTFSGFTDGDTRKLKSVKYFIAEKPDTTYVLDSELTGAAVVPSADYTTYDVVIKDVTFGSKVVYQYTISDDKKDDLVVTKVTDDASSITTTIKQTEFALSTERPQLTDDTKAKVKVTVAPEDKALYTYEVYVAKLDPNSASYESVTTWTPLTVELKAATDKLSWVAEVSTTLTPTEPTKDSTTEGKTVSYSDKFVFKYVKTNTKYVSTNKAKAVNYSEVVEVTKKAK